MGHRPPEVFPQQDRSFQGVLSYALPTPPYLDAAFRALIMVIMMTRGSSILQIGLRLRLTLLR